MQLQLYWRVKSKADPWGDVVAVAQTVDRVILKSKDRRFDPWLQLSMCQSILGKDTEPQVGVFEWEIAAYNVKRFETADCV